MKPSNTLLALLCAFSMAFVSCNQNEPTRGDETQKNQPANPSTWSPAGKTYVLDEDTINKDGYRYTVIDFVSSDSAISFFAAKEDLTPISFIRWGYECMYPELKLTKHQDWLPMNFKDTLTLQYTNSSGTFYLR